MLKFNVLINPFTRKMLVSGRVNKSNHEAVVEYDDLDEWNAFMFDNEVFDIHILYEDELEISIYRVNSDNNTIMSETIQVKYKIVSKDEF